MCKKKTLLQTLINFLATACVCLYLLFIFFGGIIGIIFGLSLGFATFFYCVGFNVLLLVFGLDDWVNGRLPWRAQEKGEPDLRLVLLVTFGFIAFFCFCAYNWGLFG